MSTRFGGQSQNFNVVYYKRYSLPYSVSAIAVATSAKAPPDAVIAFKHALHGRSAVIIALPRYIKRACTKAGIRRQQCQRSGIISPGIILDNVPIMVVEPHRHGGIHKPGKGINIRCQRRQTHPRQQPQQQREGKHDA